MDVYFERPSNVVAKRKKRAEYLMIYRVSVTDFTKVFPPFFPSSCNFRLK
jgi:hypothetical protein